MSGSEEAAHCHGPASSQPVTSGAAVPDPVEPGAAGPEAARAGRGAVATRLAPFEGSRSDDPPSDGSLPGVTGHPNVAAYQTAASSAVRGGSTTLERVGIMSVISGAMSFPGVREGRPRAPEAVSNRGGS
jgi:hypothetical protein